MNSELQCSDLFHHGQMFLSPSDTVKCGILEVDDIGKVTSFLEKPHPDSTQSRKAVSYIVYGLRLLCLMFMESSFAVSMFLSSVKR